MINKFKFIKWVFVYSSFFACCEIKSQLHFYGGLSSHERGKSYSFGLFNDLNFDTIYPALRFGIAVQNYNTIFIGVNDLYLQLPLAIRFKSTEELALFGGFQFSHIINAGETNKIRLRNNSVGIILGIEAKFERFSFIGLANFGNKKYYRSYTNTWYFDKIYKNHDIDQFTLAIAYRLFD